MYGNEHSSQRQLYNMNYASNYAVQMQQTFHYPSAANNTTNVNSNNFIDDEESSLIAAMQMREHNEREIENFLIENQVDFTEAKNSNDRAARISETRCALKSVCGLNRELDNLSKELKENLDMPEAEWCAKIEAVQMKRFEICKALDNLGDDKTMSKVKRSIEKRKKKRLREKKKRDLGKIDKLAAKERRKQLHAKADAWIKDKQDLIEKEKQEVAMRKDADVVLAEVRSRRNDAKKLLALLHELKNLRRIKVNIARARGDHLSSAADEAFANIIGK